MRRRLVLSLLASSFAGIVMMVVKHLLRIAAPVNTVGMKETFQYDSEIGIRVKPGIPVIRTSNHRRNNRTNSPETDDFHRHDALLFTGDRIQHLVTGNPRLQTRLRPLQWLSETQLGLRARLAAGVLRRSRSGIVEEAQPAHNARPAAKRTGPDVERILDTPLELGAKLVIDWSDGEIGSHAWLKSTAAEHDIVFADSNPSFQAVVEAVPELTAAHHHSGSCWRGWVDSLIADVFSSQIRVLEL